MEGREGGGICILCQSFPQVASLFEREFTMKDQTVLLDPEYFLLLHQLCVVSSSSFTSEPLY